MPESHREKTGFSFEEKNLNWHMSLVGRPQAVRVCHHGLSAMRLSRSTLRGPHRPELDQGFLECTIAFFCSALFADPLSVSHGSLRASWRVWTLSKTYEIDHRAAPQPEFPHCVLFEDVRPSSSAHFTAAAHCRLMGQTRRLIL